MWCWAADRKGNIWWAPFLLPAIAPVAKPLYVGPRRPRTHARVAPAQQGTATPANPLILRASGSSSSLWCGAPHPGPNSAAVLGNVDLGRLGPDSRLGRDPHHIGKFPCFQTITELGRVSVAGVRHYDSVRQ